MSTINGLPAHVLLVHGVVVLVPLTAALLILCALWRAARSRLIWLTAGLAVLVTALTPLTVQAGWWFKEKVGSTPAIDHHAQLGRLMTYFVVPLLIAAILLVVVHVREQRDQAFGRVALAVVAVLVLAAGAGAMVQAYRVGDSGAHAVWGGIAA
ncbi:DUF2231 domain-containing protein [Nocardia sp. NPDC051030]|uniref:DUF2231 domain-containing protein n=1 Tax=Nocardia sp. NPDC051030 TaxID=3155162 RepID=UPI00343D538E